MTSRLSNGNLNAKEKKRKGGGVHVYFGAFLGIFGEGLKICFSDIDRKEACVCYSMHSK